MASRLVLLLILLLTQAVTAQDLNAKLTPAQAAREVKALVRLLEATHPDPYINLGGKIAFKREAEALLRSLPAAGLTVRELGDRLDPFLRRLRDGHTFLFYYTDKWRDPDWWLPVRFGAASDGLFVSAFDLQELAGTQGWRLVGAGGVSLDELLARRARDGARENLYGELASFGNVLSSLKFMNNLLGGMTADGNLTYTLEAPDGRRENRTIPWRARGKWDPDKALVSTVRWSGLERSNEMFSYQIFEHPSAAYFRVSTIMGREAYEMARHANPENGRKLVERYYQQRKLTVPGSWEAAIEGIPSLFETTERLLNEMKRRSVPSLIIDLRRNSGGWTPSVFPSLQAIYGDDLYAKPMPGRWVTVESALYLQKNAESPEDRRKQDPSFEVGQYVFSQDDDRPSAEQRRKQRASEYRSAGYAFAKKVNALGGSAVYTPRRVVVLCDPNTFSAAFHTMMYLRAMGAKIVGVPSQQSPNAFMEMTEFTLPESKLRGSISNSAQIFLPEDPEARVLQPDYPVTIQIYRRYGLDVETPLRYALELLAAGRL